MVYRTHVHLPPFVPSDRYVILGIVVTLFFRCVGALLNPINRTREGVRWGLIAYTAATVLFVTIFTVTTLCMQSLSYIEDREFFNTNDFLPPGPLGYFGFSYSDAINVVPNIMFYLNTWLINGLLVSLVSESATEQRYLT